jgi:hypothetical protein
VMLAARLSAPSLAAPLSRGLHYVALLREPITRLLSEFYETYDGWEAKFGTPPKLPRGLWCSSQLSEQMQARARSGIDNVTKAECAVTPHPISSRRSPSHTTTSPSRSIAYHHIAPRPIASQPIASHPIAPR